MKDFDENGDLARKGNIEILLLEQLNSLDFISRCIPNL
jgi:hypothetical protein